MTITPEQAERWTAALLLAGLKPEEIRSIISRDFVMADGVACFEPGEAA
jgi:hypothetical protein